MQFEDQSWMDVESYLKHDDRVVVVTGACEQHGYLSLLTDIRVPVAVAQAACRIEKVLVAPPLPYGISPYFTAYPGTISLRPETFAGVVREVIDGLVAQGFRRLLVSNGHGGNTGVLIPLMNELCTAHPGIRMAFFESWRDPAVVKAAEEVGLPTNHANWSEAFAFTQVGAIPEGNKPDAAVPRVASAEEVRAALGDGNYGGPYQAPADVMDHLFDAAVGAMVALLRAL